MNHIKLFEEFKIKPRAVDVPVYSTGQRPVTADNKKVIRKQDLIVATDKTIMQIVKSEIARLGKDADLNHIDVSQVTDMSALFAKTDFQGDVSQWDVSNVKYMYYTFERCFDFNCDLSGWNVSSVKDMNGMFYYCSKFNQDISSWDVSKVTDMNWMFYYCTDFNQDLSKWDVSNVEKMYGMFCNCFNFNQDISCWDISKVVTNMSFMFYGSSIKEEYKPKFKNI